MQGENLAYNNNFVDLDPNVKDAWGLSAPRVTYKLYDNDLKQRQFIIDKMKEIVTKAGAKQVWTGAPPANTAPGPHPMGTTRMGNDANASVVNRYCQSWDHPNLFIVGSSNFPSAAGFNPTETINALAYWSADYIKREVKPGGSLTKYL